MGSIQVSLYRFLGQGICCGLVMIFNKTSPRAPNARIAKLMIFRSFLSTGGMLCFFYSLSKLSMSSATTLVYINPILTAILGAIVRLAC
jgi:drug/metabolite transporter (DMT)-like permease